MGFLTHLPVADWRNDGWSIVGAVSSLFAALNNDNDSLYIKCPASKAGATVSFPVDISSVPDGAIITSVTVKLRCSTGAGSAPAGVPPSVTIAVAALDDTSRFTTRTIYPTATITTYEVATYQRDALGFLWDVERLNHILCRVFSYVGIFDLIRCHKFYCEIKYRVRPTITVDAPSGVVNTPSPTISWTYTQTDGDPQTRSEYKLFTALQQAQPTFNPETDPPVFSATVEGDLSSVTLPTSINSDSYWVYVRSYSSFGAKSVWQGRQFTVEGVSPAPPGVPDGAETPGVGIIDVVPDVEQGSAMLRLQDTSNMLSAQVADAEDASEGTSFTTSNCALARDTTAAFPGGSSSWKMTASGAGTMSTFTDWVEVSGPGTSNVTARAQYRTAATARSCRVRILFYDAGFTLVDTLTGSSVADSTSTWTDVNVSGLVPLDAVYAVAAFDVLSAASSEVHNIDHLLLAYGVGTPFSDGGHASRNLLSSWYSTVEGTAGAGESWTAASASSTTTVATTGLGASGSVCNKVTYNGLSPTLGFRAAGTVFTSPTSGPDYTLNKPAGVVSGDLLLAFITTSEASCTVVPPAGWALVDSVRIEDGSTDTTLTVLKRTAGGSEPSSWSDGSLTVNASRRTAVVAAYSGAANASEQFISEAVGGTANSNPMFTTVPAINNTDPNAWRVSAFAVSDNASGGTLVANRQQPSTVPAISYVGNNAWYSTTSGNSIYTIRRPAGVVSGDVMVATVAVSGTVTVTPPSGWTVRYTGQASGYTQAVLSRTAGGSEPSAWNGSLSGPQNKVSATGTVAYRNVNPTTPFITESGRAVSSASSVTTNSVTNTNSMAWRVEAFGSLAGSSNFIGMTSNEVSERLDYFNSWSGGWFGGSEIANISMYDSNGAVSTGSHNRTGYAGRSFYGGVGWIGLLNPLAAPPSGVANETTRATATVGSANPWMTTIVADSNGVVPTGNQALTGVWTPGSGADMNAMAGWVGHVKPAAAVIAGYASATMASTVDISGIAPGLPHGDKMTASASFLGSTAGTAFLTVNFYRANQLLNTAIGVGVAFNTSVWAKAVATFDIPEGTTRVSMGVSASDRAVADYMLWDRASLALGSDTVARPGTSRSTHPVWSAPLIQFADDDGTGYAEFADLTGTLANPPLFQDVSGVANYVDHTVIPLTNRTYRAKTVSYGLAGDLFVSEYGPSSSEFSFVAESWWLKDIENPDNNLQVSVRWDSVSVNTKNTAVVFQPLGEDLPVVLSEGYKGDMFSLNLVPVGHDRWVALRKLLTSGRTLFLQSDIDMAWWVRPVEDTVSSVLATNQRQSKPLREIKVQFVQVTPPGV